MKFKGRLLLVSVGLNQILYRQHPEVNALAMKSFFPCGQCIWPHNNKVI